MQQLFMSQQSIKPSYLAFLLVNMCVCVRVCVYACACVVCMCAMQGISLVVKIKTTSGKSVFCCFRTSGGGSYYRSEVGRGCVCAVFEFPRGFGPRTRAKPVGKAAVGAGCSAGAAGLPRRGSRRSAPASPPAAPRKHRRIPAGCQRQELPTPG